MIRKKQISISYNKNSIQSHLTVISEKHLTLSFDKYRSQNQQYDQHVQTIWVQIQNKEQQQKEKLNQNEDIKFKQYIYPKIRCLDLYTNRIIEQQYNIDKKYLIGCRSKKLTNKLNLKQEQNRTIHFKNDQIPYKITALQNKSGFISLLKDYQTIKFQKFDKKQEQIGQNTKQILSKNKQSSYFHNTLYNLNDQYILTHKTKRYINIQQNNSLECLEMIDIEYESIVKIWTSSKRMQEKPLYNSKICLIDKNIFCCGINNFDRGYSYLALFDIRMKKLANILVTSLDQTLKQLSHSLKPNRNSYYLDYEHLLNISKIQQFSLFSILNIGYGNYCYPIKLDLRNQSNYQLLTCFWDQCFTNLKQIKLQKSNKNEDYYIWSIERLYQNVPERQYVISENKIIN